MRNLAILPAFLLATCLVGQSVERDLHSSGAQLTKTVKEFNKSQSGIQERIGLLSSPKLTGTKLERRAAEATLLAASIKSAFQHLEDVERLANRIAVQLEVRQSEQGASAAKVRALIDELNSNLTDLSRARARIAQTASQIENDGTVNAAILATNQVIHQVKALRTDLASEAAELGAMYKTAKYILENRRNKQVVESVAIPADWNAPVDQLRQSMLRARTEFNIDQ